MKIGEKNYDIGNSGSYVIESVDNITSSYYDDNKSLKRKKIMFLDDSGFYAILTIDPYSFKIYNNNDVKIGFKILDSESDAHYFVTLDSNSTTVLYDSSNDLIIGEKINSVFNDGSYILNYLDLSESKFYDHASNYVGIYKVDPDNTGFFYIEYSDNDISHFDSNGNLITNKTINDDNSYQIENGSGTIIEYYDDTGSFTHIKNINNDNSYTITNADASVIQSFDIDGILVSTKNINNDGSYNIALSDNITTFYYDNSGFLMVNITYDQHGAFIKTIYNLDGSYSVTSNDIDFDNYDTDGNYIDTTTVDNGHSDGHDSDNVLEKLYTLEILNISNNSGYDTNEIIGAGYSDQGIGEISYINHSDDEFIITGHSDSKYHWYYKDDNMDSTTNQIQIIAWNGIKYIGLTTRQYHYEGLEETSRYRGYGEITSSIIDHENEKYIDHESPEVLYNSFIPTSYTFTDPSTFNITENTSIPFKVLGTDNNGQVIDISDHIRFESDNNNIFYSNGIINSFNDLGTTISDIYYDDNYIKSIEIKNIAYKSYCVDDLAVNSTGYAGLDTANRDEFVTCGYVYRGYGEIINPGASDHYAFLIDKQYKSSESDDDFYEFYVKDNGDGTYLLLTYYYGSVKYGFYKLLDDPSTLERVRLSHRASGWAIYDEETDLVDHINIKVSVGGNFYEE